MTQTRYHQKAESLRAASLSKLDNMVNNNSNFNTKRAEFSTKWQNLLSFNNPTCAYNHRYNLHQNVILQLQLISHPYSPLLVHKTILTIPISTLFLCNTAVFQVYIFAYSHPYNLLQKHFSHLSHLAHKSCVKRPVSNGIL